MGPLLATLLMIGIVAFAVVASNRQTARLRELWTLAGNRLGLSLADPRQLRLMGMHAGFSVEVQAFMGKNASTTFMVHGLPQHLIVRGESMMSALGKIVSGKDVECGDERFDGKIFVRSSTDRDADVQGLLSAKVRSALTELVATGATIEHGYIMFRKGGVVSSPEMIEATVQTLVHTAALVSERARMQPGPALAELATDDASPRVRSKALDTLIAKYDRESPFVQRACRVAATSDSAPATRMRAALTLGKEGVPILRKIVDSVGSGEVRAQALDYLCQNVDAAESLSILEKALADAEDIVRAFAARRLSRRKAPPSAVALLARSSRDPSMKDEWLAWHAEALATIDSSEVEAPLLALLDRESVDVRVAAARGLARRGTRASVEKLLPLTQGFTLDSTVKQSAREAVDAIQARLAGAGAGQLAISEDEQAGSLSEPEKPGALSFTKKQTT